MIKIECDNCEKTFEVDDEKAGQKAPCPECGDVNRIPVSVSTREPERGSERRGPPPDEGPEQEICVVHPAMFRAHPFRGLLLLVLLIGGVVLGITAQFSGSVPKWLSYVGLVFAAGAIGWWVVWYIAAHLWVKLTISNKRTIRQEGIIRRATSEVLHDHVRNVEIKQSFIQRIFGTGYLGISSAGQDDIEIEVFDLPKPYEIKALIDEYRDM